MIIGSQGQVKLSFASLIPPQGEALWPAMHLENLFLKLNQAHRGKRQKATGLTFQALRISACFINRDQLQQGFEVIVKTDEAKGNIYFSKF